MKELEIQLTDTLPPIYHSCIEVFGKEYVDFEKGTVFAYGDRIHTKNELYPDLLIHEMTHMKQQELLCREDKRKGAEVWWNRYLKDPKFRLEQEIEAYRAQFNYIRTNWKDKNRVAKALHSLSKDLSSGMYGNIISFEAAKIAIMKK